METVWLHFMICIYDSNMEFVWMLVMITGLWKVGTELLKERKGCKKNEQTRGLWKRSTSNLRLRCQVLFFVVA